MKRFYTIVIIFLSTLFLMVVGFMLYIGHHMGNAQKRVAEEMKLHISEAAQFVDEYSSELDILMNLQLSLEANKNYRIFDQQVNLCDEGWELLYEYEIEEYTEFSDAEKLALKRILPNIYSMSVSATSISIIFLNEHSNSIWISNSADGKPNYREQLNETWFVEIIHHPRG